jgi:DNA polymerase-3 subunit alpha
MERLLECARARKETKLQNQSSLFSLVSNNSSLPQLRLEKSSQASLEEKLKWEKELLGVYVSGHPLEKITQSTNYQNTKNKLNIELFKTQKPAKLVNVAGLITESRRIFTKNNDPMMFIKLQDLSGEIECVIFPKILQEFGHHIIPDN